MLLNLPASLLSCLLPLFPLIAAQSSSSKRGLVYIGNNKHAATDASIWYNNSDLTWYYSYSANPVPELEASPLEFVPMYWGEPDETTFREAITSRKQAGENITYVLGFNEPDMDKDVGGSDLSPSDAAKLWQEQIEPLRELGIKVGAPAVSGSPIGYAWMQDWYEECDGKCTPDFMPTHWYGVFDAFASWIQNVSATYPDLDIWVTEFGLPGASLEETQTFFNQSIQMLDENRYAYFGSTRASSSNTGSNSAMLTNGGELTDIGSLYLGGNATGNEPGDNLAARAAPGLMTVGLAMSAWAVLMLAS